MLVESMVIFGLIFAVAVIYLRRKKARYAVATVPLLLLPFMNIIANFLGDKLSNLLKMEYFVVYSFLNLLAVVISCLIIGICSVKFSRKSTRVAYVAMSLIFNIALASILIFNA